MAEEDLVPISALQHYLYCPRQCALIHLEQQWAENANTAQGRVLHERTDKPRAERRRGVRTVTALPLYHPELGLTGIADAVEFYAAEAGELPFPVEYKRGRPKSHQADEVQLCAQALCLETMLARTVPAGALFYGETRRRVEVAFSPQLRELTTRTAAAVRAMLRSGTTPLADYAAKRCDGCSLLDLCQPRLLRRLQSVSTWLACRLDES
ncbi:CRISPR-associated protein Cas4 [Ramlibacter sp.]|uniref:CRISPR-associated protein Cas4 n=1 Tax=Ramlibacter sp. TaxID=1917967 RepID=UPI0017AF460B|nr:CRISPR-associated protein Cas4 [Ramlibacter sp.]MBA2673045.1 CRISPR-associated protein Cas4 [Ramlibacter sp.]